MAAARVVIVGGGVSGLSTAYFLSQAGVASLLVEKSNRLGGLIQTEVVEGCCLEAGPDSYLAAKPAVTELAAELRVPGGALLHDEIIGSNDAQRRILIARRGRLIPAPRGLVMMAPAEWRPALASPLFSVHAKMRFLRETLRAPYARTTDVSVGELVRDHFGGEVLKYLAEPLLAGVYGGEAAHLSAQSVLPRFLEYERKYGSIVRGVRYERRKRNKSASLFLSFNAGMQSLPDALAASAGSSCQFVHSRVTAVERAVARWRIHTKGNVTEAEHVVLACPAYAAAELLDRKLPALASELAAIPYSSALLVTLLFDKAAFDRAPDAFGFLVPQAERETIAAATWIGTKFPMRLRAELAAIRAFIVEPEASSLLSASRDDLVSLVLSDLERLTGITDPPRFATVHRWPNSMPQYVVGHALRREAIERLAADAPGLHLVGNSYSGVGVPDCVVMAKETAKKIVAQLTSAT